MNIHIEVEIEDTGPDADFFRHLVNGDYAQVPVATIWLPNGATGIDASWLLRATVSVDHKEQK